VIQLLISWGPAALWAGALFFLSAQSYLPGGPTFPFGDKVAHFLLYGVLGLALAWAGRRSRRRSLHVALILVGILFAASDEWHQAFVPLRDLSVGDFVADTVGIVVGYLVARALFLKGRASGEAS
jgi:VanZ family protein